MLGFFATHGRNELTYAYIHSYFFTRTNIIIDRMNIIKSLFTTQKQKQINLTNFEKF